MKQTLNQVFHPAELTGFEETKGPKSNKNTTFSSPHPFLPAPKTSTSNTLVFEVKSCKPAPSPGHTPAGVQALETHPVPIPFLTNHSPVSAELVPAT